MPRQTFGERDWKPLTCSLLGPCLGMKGGVNLTGHGRFLPGGGSVATPTGWVQAWDKAFQPGHKEFPRKVVS